MLPRASPLLFPRACPGAQGGFNFFEKLLQNIFFEFFRKILELSFFNMLKPPPRRVPSSSCLPVPDLVCYNVLKPLQDVACQPVVSRDCRNVSVEVPYITQESQCDEIVYDECQEVLNLDPQ